MIDRYTPESTSVSDWESTFDSDFKRIQLSALHILQTSSQNYFSSWSSLSIESDSREEYVIMKIQITFSASRVDIPIDSAILHQEREQQQNASRQRVSASSTLNFDVSFLSRAIVSAKSRIQMSSSSKSAVRKSSRKRKNQDDKSSTFASKTKKTTKQFNFTSTNDAEIDTNVSTITIEIDTVASTITVDIDSRAKTIILDTKKNIMLIHFCLKYSKSFETKETIATWWKKIEKKFNEQLNKSFTNHNRYMKNMIKRRKFDISMLETKNENEQSSWQQTIDQWIEIFDLYENKNNNKKLIDKERKVENLKIETKRQSMLNRMKNKNLLMNSNESSIDEILFFRFSFAISNATLTFIFILILILTSAFSSRFEFVSRSTSKTSNSISRTKNKRAKVDVDVIAMQNMIASMNKWIENKINIESELEKTKRQLTTMQKKTKKIRREQQLQISQFQKQNIKLDSILETMKTLRENYIDE